MKQFVLIFSLLCTWQTVLSQTTYYKGEWTRVNKHELFTGIFKIDITNDGKAQAELVWTILAADSTSRYYLDYYNGKKGKSGIEYAEGLFSAVTNDLYLAGKEKDDPYLILGLDKYHLKLASNKQVLYGTTETEGTNEGLYYAIKLNNESGVKAFMTAKTTVKK